MTPGKIRPGEFNRRLARGNTRSKGPRDLGPPTLGEDGEPVFPFDPTPIEIERPEPTAQIAPRLSTPFRPLCYDCRGDRHLGTPCTDTPQAWELEP